jgi:flagellar biosynthesis/type III secretory pathway protein FliH
MEMEDKFEEGVERGMDLGCEEGYNVAKEGFDGIVKELKAREARKQASTSNFG